MKGPVRNTSFILCKLQESRQGLLPLIALSIYLILKRSQQGDSPLVSGVGGGVRLYPSHIILPPLCSLLFSLPYAV